MYNIPEDSLLTYNPECVDCHSDSTDFEDTHIQRVTNKYGNHSLVKTNNTKPNKFFVSVHPLSYNISSIKVSKSCSKEMCSVGEEKQKCYQNANFNMPLDSGDQIQTVKSRSLRYKVIPCISGMFKRTSNSKRISVIKRVSKDGGKACQTFHVSYVPKMRQLNRRQQCYIAQPIQEVEKKAQSMPTKNKYKTLLTRRSQKTEYCNAQYSLTSSSEVGHTELDKKEKKWISKDSVEHGVLKTHVDNSGKQTITQEKPLKRPRRKLPFQVYANPRQYTGNTVKDCTDIGSSTSAVPSSCSGFWEYLFNKINNKYQTSRPELLKSCVCRHSNITIDSDPMRQTSPKECSIQPCSVYSCSPSTTRPPDSCVPVLCIPKTMSCTQSFEKPNRGPHQLDTMAKTCPCSKLKKQLKSPKRSLLSPLLASPKRIGCPKCTDPTIPCLDKSPTPSKGSNKKNKVDCECSPRESCQNESCKDIVKPCQISHGCMANTVTQKYNGEILCIHNPPCVLINGCLNLPCPKADTTITSTTLWPVVESHRGSCQYLSLKKSPKKFVEQGAQCQAVERGCQYQPIIQSQYRVLEQSCQYQVVNQSCQYQIQSEQNDHADHGCQYYPETVNAYQVTDHRKEKMIQSSCNHKPPCEVKRTCHRPKYDPKLQTSCIHVPMCDNLPLCVVESSNGLLIRSCRHKPKCPEIPICKQHHYIDLPKPANEEVGTQVRPRSKMICRHQPPCLMIPRCLDRLCAEACCQFGAVPDCVHQPMCEMIPACCRKSAKEMVSVCSQHPNSCRIV